MTGSFPPAPPSSSLQIRSSIFETIVSDVQASYRDIGTALSESPVVALFDLQLVQAFRDLREVMLYHEYYHSQTTPLPPAELDHFNIKSYNLHYLVLTLPLQTLPSASDKQEPCCLALLIFWNANYLVGKPDSALFRTLTTQLKAVLEKSDMLEFWGPHFELLMWVLSLGAHILGGQRERAWFVLNLARGARILKLGEWVDLRKVLLRFFCLDRVYQKSLEEALQEANMLQGVFETRVYRGNGN